MAALGGGPDPVGERVGGSLSGGRGPSGAFSARCARRANYVSFALQILYKISVSSSEFRDSMKSVL